MSQLSVDFNPVTWIKQPSFLTFYVAEYASMSNLVAKYSFLCKNSADPEGMLQLVVYQLVIHCLLKSN